MYEIISAIDMNNVVNTSFNIIMGSESTLLHLILSPYIYDTHIKTIKISL